MDGHFSKLVKINNINEMCITEYNIINTKIKKNVNSKIKYNYINMSVRLIPMLTTEQSCSRTGDKLRYQPL